MLSDFPLIRRECLHKGFDQATFCDNRLGDDFITSKIMKTH